MYPHTNRDLSPNFGSSALDNTQQRQAIIRQTAEREANSATLCLDVVTTPTALVVAHALFDIAEYKTSRKQSHRNDGSLPYHL